MRQVVDAFGAFSFVPTMTHGPVSLHVFFPVDNDETSQVSGTCEFLLTIVFLTRKPGRAASFNAVDAT